MINKRKRILVVFGTRPEAIKLAPVIMALRACRSYAVTVCVTSQHREMLQQVLSIFKIRPAYDLKVMRPNQNIYDVTVGSLTGMGKVLQEVKPDLVIVQGDTTTAFAATLAAYYEHIPVAHVEAGLRTYHKYTPFPEEINRVLISDIADIHFSPTEQARKNLLLEGIKDDSIFVTGNTAIDALLLAKEKIRAMKTPIALRYIERNDRKIILVTSHRRESFGLPFQNICFALKKIAERNPNVQIVYPVHLNPNVRKPVFEILSNCKNIHLLDPLNYKTFVWLMSNCYLILTDSGGVQEEAPALGKPVLVMREMTERAEGIEAGVARLVGTAVADIVRETEQLLRRKSCYKKMARKANPYGNGTSAQQIAAAIKKYYKPDCQKLPNKSLNT